MTDALVAALMMQQRQRQQFDPAENSRRYGQMLLQQGASMAPVQSPLEGLARALTGGVGGFFEGMAERDQKETQTKTMDKLARALGASDEVSRNAILNEAGGDPSILAPFYAQTLAQKIADERKNKILDTKLDASGLGGAGQTGLGGGQPGPLTINMTPLPNATPSPTGFNNNVGNIRATNINWDGKGAPQNGFETFSTPQQGVNAAFKNLGYYVQQNPNITVAQAIAKWAPPNENNTQQYISQVAEGTGINPGMPLSEVLKDPAVAAMLLDAITRKEKGGLPQGVTADTFMTATGGQPQATQAPVQLAQGSSEGAPQPQAAPQQAPVTTMPEVSPAAQQLLQQAQQARAGGDRERALALVQKAQEAQAAYVQERAKTQDTRAYAQSEDERKRAAEAEEHDRRERTKTMTKEQSDAATFADRMVMANRSIDKLEEQGLSAKGRALDTTVFGVGIPGANYAQSKEYQQYRQARENFAYALLRRETGAAIQPFEYETIDKTYFPQPGDDKAVLADKRQARKVALEGMARAAGPTYTTNTTALLPPPAGKNDAPPPSGTPQAGTVMDGYRFKGGDPSKQENWEPVR